MRSDLAMMTNNAMPRTKSPGKHKKPPLEVNVIGKIVEPVLGQITASIFCYWPPVDMVSKYDVRSARSFSPNPNPAGGGMMLVPNCLREAMSVDLIL